MLKLAILLLTLASGVHGYAYYFTSETFCSVRLSTESTIMGAQVEVGNTRHIVIQRGDVSLEAGSIYFRGEILNVSLSELDIQYAIEIVVGDAVFIDGSCNGTKVANRNASMILPSNGPVVLQAGSASSYGTVYLTEKFTLTDETGPESPLPKPPPRVPPFPTFALNSTEPTAVPSDATIMITMTPTNPTMEPTDPPTNHTMEPTDPPTNPTMEPTDPFSFPPLDIPTEPPTGLPTPALPGSDSPTLSPSANTTLEVVVNISDVPTLFPSQAPAADVPTPVNNNNTMPTLFQIITTNTPTDTAANESSPSSRFSASSVVTGLLISLLVGLLLGLLLYKYVVTYEALQPLLSQLQHLPLYLSVLLLVIMVAMALQWAGTSTAEQAILRHRAVAAHAVLMVVGFYGCQCLALNVLILLEQWSRTALLLHVVLMTVALLSMAVGLAKIINHYQDSRMSTLTTLHSWYGVAAISVFGLTFAIGK